MTKMFLPPTKRPDARQSFVRAAAVELLRFQRHGQPAHLVEGLERHIPGEQHRDIVEFLTRSDASPATTGG